MCGELPDRAPGKLGPTWALVPKARTRARARESRTGGPASGSRAPALILQPALRRLDTSHSPPEVKTSRRETPRRTPAHLRVPAADSRGRAPPREPPRGPAGPSAHAGRRLLIRRSARDRAAPERRTKGRAGRVRCPAASPGLPVPTAASLTRNRGPHRPSPASVRGTPAPLMLRTVGREAPASARAQRRGARAAHC